MDYNNTISHSVFGIGIPGIVSRDMLRIFGGETKQHPLGLCMKN